MLVARTLERFRSQRATLAAVLFARTQTGCLPPVQPF